MTESKLGSSLISSIFHTINVLVHDSVGFIAGSVNSVYPTGDSDVSFAISMLNC